MPDLLTQLPEPSGKRIALRVQPAAERALRQGHPWLFDGAIQHQSHAGQPGDLAVVFDSQRKFLAIGLYDPHSPIRVRILQHRRPANIDQAWFAARLQAARQRRQAIPPDTDGYRLVHGENDGLPGLVVDRYAGVLVVHLDTAAWIPHLRPVVSELKQQLKPDSIVLRLARSLAEHPLSLHGLVNGSSLTGDPLKLPLFFHENGLTFEVNPLAGQKTGFFLDQRENRARVESLANGRQVLNVFAYSGGFSLYAARGGAPVVESVDLSQPALQSAEHNFQLNQDQPNVAACRHRITCADAFDFLEQVAQHGQNYDLVILDPPAFARRQADIGTALHAYQRLTHLGLAVLRPGGILVQASCSSRVPAEDFFAAIHQAAAEAGRALQEIERSGHAIDHPVGFPEGAYLRCLFGRG